MSLRFRNDIPKFPGLGGSNRLKACLLCFLLLTSLQTVTGQKTSSGSKLNSATVSAIKNLVFPRLTDQFSVLEDVFAMDVRITPSFGAPVQVSFIKRQDDNLSVRRSTLSDETRSLGEQVRTMVENGEPVDIEILSRKLNVVNRELTNAKKLEPNLRLFFEKTRFSTSKSLTLDGVGYEIWYKDAQSEVYFLHIGGESFEAGELPLITWARNLNKETAALLGERRPRAKE